MKVDILIPSHFEKEWTGWIRPALEALGISKNSTFQRALGDLKQARIWPMRIQLPKRGSVVMARGKGEKLRHRDIQVHLDEDKPELGPRELFVRVDSVYGITIQAVTAELADKEDLDLVDRDYLVISTDFITLVVDILPGKDAFVVVGMWVTSKLPLFILTQQNHSYTSKLSFNSFRWIKKGEVEFLVTCRNCDGSGQVVCKTCDGAGEWQPDGHCNKCGGSCKLTCDRCGGSGDFIGKYGDRMGDCNCCSGTGSIRCYVCKGSGEPPILSCNACDGSGYWTCRKCSGTSVHYIPFLPYLGRYGFYNESFLASAVSGWDATGNVDYSLDRGARSKLEQLIEDFGIHVGRQKKIKEVQNEISKISHCLDRAMEAEGMTEEILNFRSPPLGLPKPTTERIKHRLVLAFPLLKRPAWVRSGDCPLPPNTSVLFLENRSRRSEIEIPITRSKLPIEPAKPVFVRMEMIEDRAHLLISLPNDVAVNELPVQFVIKPDVPTPAELAQKKELSRWCSPDGAPELLETLAIDSGEYKAPPKIDTDNDWINPSQQEALDWMMAGVPLVLVKGPPGTGKTTVITEAVLQSIRRNEKVLVCSETHQAVENVLEKLHQNGSIRMVRHGRAEQRQLSSLGRDYLEDSSTLSFIQSVTERTLGYITRLKSEMMALETLHSRISEAQQAATQLEMERQGFLAREKEAKQVHQNASQSSVSESQAVCQIAEEEANSVLLQIKEVIDRSEHDLAKGKKRLVKEGNKRDEAIDSYQRKTGREPDPSFNGSTSMMRKMFSLGMNKLASADHLNERFVVAVDAVRLAGVEIEKNERLIERKRLEREECHRLRDDKIGRSQKKLEQELRQALATLDQEIQSVAVDSNAAEAQFLVAQKQAVETSDSVGIFTSWQADVLPAVWNDRGAACRDRISRDKEELEFCTRWQRAAENTSAALSALFFDTAQVFLSTCVGLASWRSFAEHFGSEGVDLVIIDEAAHATLTQSLIPMGQAKRTVLIGDEMQLPPAAPMGLADKCESSCEACTCSIPLAASGNNVPFKPEMSSCWLERSAFEWISETRPWVPKVMLNKQFRMHPDIADFVSQVFYEGGLENGVATIDRQLAFGSFNKAVCLIPTSAYKDRFEDKARGATSYRNRLESQLTKRILKQAKRHLEADTSFGVLTPYSAQKELMQRELVEFFDGSGHLKFKQEDIASVDSFQGSERDVMIASFVRSPQQAPRKCKPCDGTGRSGRADCVKCNGSGWRGAKLNWVHDLRRLNVAFSRARKMLILVGDIEALTDQKIGTKQGTDVLHRFRQYISNRGRVLHVWEEESHE